MSGDLVITGAHGDFTIDAEIVAKGFGWAVRDLHHNMRRGLVTSLVERGEGEDVGFWRLSMRCGNRRWQAIVSADGTIAEQRVGYTRTAP